MQTAPRVAICKRISKMMGILVCPKKYSATARCPELEIGRNSAIP